MSICCSNIYVKPLFNDIQERDYLTPYKLLSNVLNTDFFKQQLQSGKVNDDIFLKYLMCRSNMRIYIFDKQQEFIEEFINVAYYKKLILNQTKYKNLVLQLKGLTQKFEDIKIKEQQVHHLHIFFTEEDISKKMELKEYDELAHESKTFIETIINAKLILNENSIKYLEYQRFDRIISFKRSISKFNKFMVWMYKNMSLLELELILVWSGMVPFTFGVRKFTDFDALVNIKNKFFLDKINKKLLSIKDKDIEIDIPTFKPPVKMVHIYLFDIQNDSLKIIKPMKEYNNELLYYNPDFNSYFFGLKIPHLISNVYFRFIDSRPARMAELIAFNKIINFKLPVPKLPKEKIFTVRYYKNKIVYKDLINYYVSPMEYEYYKKTVSKKKNFNPPLKREEIIPLQYAKTISNYLKSKYSISMTPEEVLTYINKNGISTIKEFKEIVSKI